MRPVVVCPDISSPAQSLASVINVPSNSLPWRAAFCSFCLGSFGANSGSLRQHRKAKARQSRTISRPARKVNMLDSTKHHHFRTLRHSSTWGASVVAASHVIPAELCLLVTHSPALNSKMYAAFDALHYTRTNQSFLSFQREFLFGKAQLSSIFLFSLFSLSNHKLHLIFIFNCRIIRGMGRRGCFLFRVKRSTDIVVFFYYVFVYICIFFSLTHYGSTANSR